MIEIIWEYVVKEEFRGQFELAYGPGGAWSKLFANSPGFRGTTLLRDTAVPHHYLTIDLWDTLDQREAFLAEHKTEYAKLDADFAQWTESETEIGTFRVMAEATVRPRGKTRRRKSGSNKMGAHPRGPGDFKSV